MRLLTRADFDGLACAVLLKEMGIVDDLKLIHPKDVQDGKVEVTKDDVLANVPYVPGCGLWFDHHSSEEERLSMNGKFEGDSRPAPSAARVIYEYYGGEEKLGKFSGFLDAVDKSDTASFTIDDIRNPEGWTLLSFIMDPRTGLGRYHDYRISNYELMEELTDLCRTKTLEELLEVQDVKQRIERYLKDQEVFLDMLKDRSKSDGNVIILDIRGMQHIPAGNRFMIYTEYPDQNVSIRVLDGKKNLNTVFAVGHSILNRTCKTDIGSLMLKYGGGGHKAVGTCQVQNEDADRVLSELVDEMKKNG